MILQEKQSFTLVWNLCFVMNIDLRFLAAHGHALADNSMVGIGVQMLLHITLQTGDQIGQVSFSCGSTCAAPCFGQERLVDVLCPLCTGSAAGFGFTQIVLAESL